MIGLDSMKRFILPAAMLIAKVASSQAVPWLDDPPIENRPALTMPVEAMAPQVATTTVPSTVTIPAGTRVMMVLKSPLHTTSGTAGSGLYLETLFPVVQENGVVIPARTYVQGTVEANERPGHLKRTSEFRFRFTTLIFPDNLVVPIQGVLQSIPGAKNVRSPDKDGSLKSVDQTEKVIVPAAATAAGGAILGSHRAFGIGTFPGAGLGLGLGLGAVLLHRGDDISLPKGTHVEMVLVAPFSIAQAQIARNARFPAEPQAMDEPPQQGSVDNGSKRRKRQRNTFGTINPFKVLVPLD
ncbi:MAG TPA: hypothetical protein VGP65_01125 [Candidatus Angelobacter sp.]|nr:hypothetical protein [Candidatus Angelobacter sp.]